MGEGAVGWGHGKAFLQLRHPVMWGHNSLQCISANNGVLFTRGRLARANYTSSLIGEAGEPW